MPPQNPQSPKSNSSQSLGRFLRKGARAVHNWHNWQEAENKKAIANAKFPWSEVLWLGGLHSGLGFILALLNGNWAIGAWILVVGISLYCTLLAAFIDGSLLPDDWLCSAVWDALSLPWRATNHKLDLLLQRWIVSRFRHELAIDFWRGVVKILSFMTLIGLDSLGLWAGYWLSTQLW